MRFLISKNIKMNCIEWSVGRAEVNEIDDASREISSEIKPANIIESIKW